MTENPGQLAWTQRAETTFVLIASCLRLTFTAQLAVSVITSWSTWGSEIGRAVAIAVLAESGLVAMTLLIKRRSNSRLILLGDFAFMVIAMLSVAVTLDPAARFGNWRAWPQGAAPLMGVCLGLLLQRWRWVVLGTIVVATSYVIAISAGARDGFIANGGWENVIGIVGFAIACQIASRAVRASAAAADEGIVVAARLATESTMERQRRLLHDQAAILNLVASEIPEPVRSAVMAEARRAAHRIREFLANPEPVSHDAGLRSSVVEVCREFGDLPIQVNLDLFGHVVLPAAEDESVRMAMRTLLANIRVHASATAVTVHGEGGESTGWRITVSDDGVGFDVARTPLGFGLSRVVNAAMASINVSVTIESLQGAGTSVTLLRDADHSHGHGARSDRSPVVDHVTWPHSQGPFEITG